MLLDENNLVLRRKRSQLKFAVLMACRRLANQRVINLIFKTFKIFEQMKNSFLIIGLAIFSMCILQSCAKEDANEVKPTVSNSLNGALSVYCTEIDEYVEENYPGAVIDEVVFQLQVPTPVQFFDIYTVTLVDDTGAGYPCLIFDENCVFMGDSPTCPE